MSFAIEIEAESPSLAPGFERLYADHYDFLWRCALRLGAAPSDVEDIIQETFVIALRRYDQTQFSERGAKPSTWLFAILHNVLRNHARGERRRRTRLEAVAVAEHSRVVGPLQAQASLGLRLLDEFLVGLDPDRRVVFVLAELEGMRGPEIARALGLNANTVRSRLRSARQAFAICFEQEPEPVVAHGLVGNLSAPPEMRARGLALLMLPTKPWATTTSAIGWWGWISGLLVAVGVVVVVAGVQARQHELPERATTTEPARLLAAAPSTRTTAVAPTAVELSASAKSSESSDIEDPAPIVVEAKPTRARPTPKVTNGSSEALALLERARAAMRSGDAAAALAIVEGRYGWPASLDAHRVALEIGALCRLDRPERARTQAQAWSQAHPGATTAVALVAPCWGDDNTSPEGGHERVKAPTSGPGE
jgi:RNA polymerase sigma factor (sigma-70 family)